MYKGTRISPGEIVVKLGQTGTLTMGRTLFSLSRGM